MGEFLVDHFSFSQLKQAEECPYAWYLQKLARITPAENAFAQAGMLAHDILARWATGKARREELPLLWIEGFRNAVTVPFPPYLAAKGYESKLFENVLTFFEQFDGFPDYEVIGAEREFHSSIAGEHFVGVIDLILRHIRTGDLMIVDFKSCSLASFRKSKESMYRQLQLYSKYCADEYGTFPTTLRFSFIKENAYDERAFVPDDYVEARKWATSQIEKMKGMDVTDWLSTRPEPFRCTALCSCRNECIYGDPEMHKKKKMNSDDKRNAAA